MGNRKRAGARRLAILLDVGDLVPAECRLLGLGDHHLHPALLAAGYGAEANSDFWTLVITN
ncbi:MAG TPA: hypothetical protein VFO20_00435, partial [Propionibacteriaceae bacterium]|nr:hypothetical protein [Propionibacteriaceae bacterium]